MHKNNKHQDNYNFESLVRVEKDLKPLVFVNNFGHETIDFSDPKAVKLLNKALLKLHYNINYWEFPDEHLCPPIPGRVDYIHHLAEYIKSFSFKNQISLLDIGTGATCIYPLLAVAECDWKVVATDIDTNSLKNAARIITNNNLNDAIRLRKQEDRSHMFSGILYTDDLFTLSMCNPPFYKSKSDALASTQRKLKGLGKDEQNPIRNFSGTANELWFEGGEKAFLHSYLYESSLYKKQCFRYSILVSNKGLVKSMETSLKKLGATEVKVISMEQGHKLSRIVVWTFLSNTEQKDWLK